jgi:hypothetical protein
MSPTMRQTHVAGDRLFVDYASTTLEAIDGSTGETIAAQLFVAALGASSYTYPWRKCCSSRTAFRLVDAPQRRARAPACRHAISGPRDDRGPDNRNKPDAALLDVAHDARRRALADGW